MASRKRLDTLLVERGLAGDREQAGRLLGAGRVVINGLVGGKAGSLLPVDTALELKPKKKYVSRAGDKLAACLSHFGIDPRGMVCVDVGCSTGGFTDCLLQRGAGRVYAVDVGYGLLDWKLRQDDRVTVLERTNGRYLSRRQIPEGIDLGVVDASFISLTLLLRPLVALAGEKVSLLALVKPQFELPRRKVARGGVVREAKLHAEAIASVERFAGEMGLRCQGSCESPVRGQRGNREFFIWLTRGGLF